MTTTTTSRWPGTRRDTPSKAKALPACSRIFASSAGRSCSPGSRGGASCIEACTNRIGRHLGAHDPRERLKGRVDGGDPSLNCASGAYMSETSRSAQAHSGQRGHKRPTRHVWHHVQFEISYVA